MSRPRDYIGKAPFFQKWDEKAFQFDTMHMRWQARLLYKDLLQKAWHTSTRPDLPSDDAQLCNILGISSELWDEHRAVVRAMFTLDEAAGVLWQKRLREDWFSLSMYRLQQKKRIDARWAAAKKKRAAMENKTQPVDTTVEPANYQSNTSRVEKSRKTKTREKETLPSSHGEAPPPPPPLGERSDAAGLLEPPLPSPEGKRLPAVGTDTTDKENLADIARLYSEFSNWLYDLVPEPLKVEALLQDFMPFELLMAQIKKFPPSESMRGRKSDFGYFFRSSARTLIEAARLDGSSKVKPDWIVSMETKSKTDPPHCAAHEGPINKAEFISRWDKVLAAWRETQAPRNEGSQIPERAAAQQIEAEL